MLQTGKKQLKKLTPVQWWARFDDSISWWGTARVPRPASQREHKAHVISLLLGPAVNLHSSFSPTAPAQNETLLLFWTLTRTRAEWQSEFSPIVPTRGPAHSCMSSDGKFRIRNIYLLRVGHTKNLTWRQQSTVYIVQEFKHYIYNGIK